ncbi:MAG: hypothetical protein K2W95_29085 [Candidatus Obscuribacterales bacterium]|nr:hypothetical protein [Candidatus Obscuribacterales bacterium]
MYDCEDSFECEETDVEDEFGDAVEAAGSALAAAVMEHLALERAAEKLDEAVEASGLSRLEKKSVKQLEHAILAGDPAEIARGLRAIDEIRRRGDLTAASAIQERVSEDFRKAGVQVTFDAQGGIELTTGAPRFFSVDKDGNFSSRFWSGQLTPPAEESELPSNPLARLATEAIRVAQSSAQEIEDKRTTLAGLQYLGTKTADNINRGR